MCRAASDFATTGAARVAQGVPVGEKRDRDRDDVRQGDPDESRHTYLRRRKTTTTTVEEEDFELVPPPVAASGDGLQRVEPPSLTGRSDVEMRNTAHLLEVLWPDLNDRALLHAFWQALRTGDAHERSDSGIELADGLLLLFEWDGGAWHTEERVAKDIRKVNRMLASDPRAVVLRVRADGAPPLDEAIATGVADPRDRGRIVLVQLDPGQVHVARALLVLVLDRPRVRGRTGVAKPRPRPAGRRTLARAPPRDIGWRRCTCPHNCRKTRGRGG